MIVKRIELDNFRNYELLKLDLDGKTNILYGLFKEYAKI